MPSLVKIDKIAKALNLSDRRVRQLVQEGVFPREAHGLYDLAKCLLAHHHYLQKCLREHNGTGENGAGGGGLTNERERHIRVQRERMELRLAKERGQLIPLETYRQTLFQDMQTLRERLLQLSQIAPQLEGEPREAIARKLDLEIHKVLESLSRIGHDHLPAHARIGDGPAGDPPPGLGPAGPAGGPQSQ
jgi:transcriptional antiterminator